MEKEAKILQLKKILTKASSLEKGKELSLAQEFISLDFPSPIIVTVRGCGYDYSRGALKTNLNIARRLSCKVGDS